MSEQIKKRSRINRIVHLPKWIRQYWAANIEYEVRHGRKMNVWRNIKQCIWFAWRVIK